MLEAEKIHQASLEQKKKLDKIVTAAFCIFLVFSAIFYVCAATRKVHKLDILAKWMLFGAVVCASAFIVIGAHFDIVTGATSSISRGGGQVSASSSSFMFWIIIVGKIMVAAFVLLIASKILKKN